MALTPEDVVNKRFQPTKFREGYDQDEVDDFLDEVVVELRRLGQENEDLRQRLLSGESSGGGSSESSGAESYVSNERSAAESRDEETVETVAAVAAPIAYSAPVDTGIGDTNNLLLLARKLHEEHVREGIEKRDELIAEGHATAARLVGEAEDNQRAQIGVLEQQRTSLEERIEDLRTFEREYRQKLKGYIEGQLHELDENELSAVSVAAGGASAFGSVSTPAPFQGFGGN